MFLRENSGITFIICDAFPTTSIQFVPVVYCPNNISLPGTLLTLSIVIIFLTLVCSYPTPLSRVLL